MRYLPFVVYAIAIGLGFVAGCSAHPRLRMSVGQAKQLSRLIGWIAYPAMAFSSITRGFTREVLLAQWALPAVELAMMLFGAALGWLLLRFYQPASREISGTMGFNFTIGNYIFLPLPLATFLWGANAGPPIVLASLGAELAFWTIGVGFLTRGTFAIRKFFTPVIFSILVALAVVIFAPPSSRDLVLLVDVPLNGIGQITIPLAMFLLGYHLAGAMNKDLWQREVLLVTIFRGLFIPLAFVLCARHFQMNPEMFRPLFLVATMPVAVASVYMSDLYDGDPDFAAKCVLAGHFFSVVSVPLWLSCIL